MFQCAICSSVITSVFLNWQYVKWKTSEQYLLKHKASIFSRYGIKTEGSCPIFAYKLCLVILNVFMML